MGEGESKLRFLAAELADEIASVDHTLGELVAALAIVRDRKLSPLERYGMAALVESFYTGVERALDRIAAVFGSRSKADGWHRRLLNESALDVPGVRMAVLSKTSVETLEPLLAFRHRVRNLYAFQLDEARVVEIAQTVPGSWTVVRAELIQFSAGLTIVG